MNQYGYDLDDDDTVEEILWDWEILEEEKILDRSRWSLFHSKVDKSPLGVLYQITWQSGATEYQDCEPDYQMVKVKPVTKTITTYVIDKD